MIHTIFNTASTEQKLTILEFLKEQAPVVSFTCKKTVISFLQNRNIATENIFQDESLNFLGRIIKTSTDGLVYILHSTGKGISFPLEYLENISLQK